MNKALLSCGITCAMLLAGCGGSKPPETAKEEAAAPASAPAAIDEANAATVTGKVSFTGEKPAMRTLDMSANPACARAHAGAPPKSEEVMIAVKCNVPPWMRSYIGVVNHPFFAVTGDDGTFTIKGLPPGKYTIQAWHEKYQTKDVEVTVAAKDSKTVDFEFKGV